MTIRIKKRTLGRFRKRIEKSRNWLLACFIAILVSSMMIHSNDEFSISAAAYKPLLSTIAKGESGGNYNAYFGSPKNDTIRFTDMTVAEVLQWQNNFVSAGNVSSAVGKYQIIEPTLQELVRMLHIESTVKFDEDLQDRLAIALLERRGSIDYANDKISREQFAANIAKEWAALPKMTGPNPHESYYGSDGINKSNITVNEVNSALDTLRDTAQDDG